MNVTNSIFDIFNFALSYMIPFLLRYRTIMKVLETRGHKILSKISSCVAEMVVHRKTFYKFEKKKSG